MAVSKASNTLFMTPEETERVRKKVQDRTRKCQDSKGEPRQSSDPRSLIAQATSTSLMSDIAFAPELGGGPPKHGPDTMVAFPIGYTYTPCTTALRDLQPMKLSELRMETHHRGRVLSLRRVAPVVEIVASSWTVVQGESPDEVERLEMFVHKSRHGEDVLESGSEFLVKEPYYTLNNDGEPTIRIDHPSDLIVSVVNTEGPESWRNVNGNSKKASVTKTAAECKDEGNAALGKKAFLQAHASYTEGLKLVSKDDGANESLPSDLSRNRSYVNILLNRYDEAKADALASITGKQDEKSKSLDSKAYYRAGHAAYSLGQFEEAKGFFEEQEKLQPDDQDAKLNLKRVKLRLKEEASGEYDFKKIISRLTKVRRRVEAANFSGNIEVKDSPGAGRGLFATRDIEPREIIMCEKAFCVVWSHEPEAWSALACDLREDAAIRVFPAGLSKAVVQKLLNNPSQIDKVLDLCGEYQGLGKQRHETDDNDDDGHDPVLDTFQVHDIIQRNAFGAGPAQSGEIEDISNASTGIWIQTAYVNHSCLSNSKKEFAGDLMILRASSRIAAGQEITHNYDESSDYDARTALFKSTWGFKCTCALCAAEEADGPALRKKRRELEKEANDFILSEYAAQAKRVSILKAKRLRRLINDTYDNERYNGTGLPRRALLGIDQWIQEAPAR